MIEHKESYELCCPSCRRRLGGTTSIRITDARRYKCSHCGRSFDIRERSRDDVLAGYKDMEEAK